MAKFKITLNTDEMVKPDWMDDDFAHDTMRYSLTKAALVAARHRKYLCIEPHGIYKKTSGGLLEPQDREIFLSVECGTIDQAARSLSFLGKELAPWLL